MLKHAMHYATLLVKARRKMEETIEAKPLTMT